MDVKNLECFIAVAERLSFSRAAESLYLSQPALSIRINALEMELNCKLFKRTHQKVYLTEAGAALYPEAKDILARLANLNFLVQHAQPQKTSQRLHISIDETEDRTLSLVVDTIAALREEHPDLEVFMSEIQIDEYEKKLLNNKVDFCLMVLEENAAINSQFCSIPLMTENTVILTANVGDRPLEDLVATRELFLLREDSNSSRWNDTYSAFVRRYNPNAEPVVVKNRSMLLMNLKCGNGIAFFPQSLAASLVEENPGLSIVPVDLPSGANTLTLLWNRANLRPEIQLLANAFNHARPDQNP